MAENKEPHEKLTDKNNGLTDTQEVLYVEDFKKADQATDNKEENDNSEESNK